jgi:hypothetical protein
MQLGKPGPRIYPGVHDVAKTWRSCAVVVKKFSVTKEIQAP